MVHVIQRASGAVISCLAVKDSTKCWEAYEWDQQFGQNESVVIGKIQRLRKQRYARIAKVLAVSPGFTKIIENVHISRYFECSKTVLYRAENACYIDYADTWSSKQVH
jgi:hypothetical protein